jgi:hypothetical protein
MFVEDTIMRINIDRLSKLAGLPAGGNSSRRSLREGKEEMEAEGMYEDMESEGMYEDEDMESEGMYEDEDEDNAHEGMGMYEDEDMEEMIDVDETMLVQELRRAKRIMQENKRRKIMSESRKRNRKQKMFEAQLREMIDEEVQNVFDEMNYSNGWVYGKNKPRRSRNGYTHQGSFIPGIGFKR